MAGRSLRRLASCILALAMTALLIPALALAADAPRVITLKPSQFQDAVTLKGTVVSNGGKEITENGFYVGTERANLDKKLAAERPYDLTVETTTLSTSTTYYVQAYAANEEGEGLGDIVSFVTNASTQSTPTESETEKLAADIRKLYGVQVVMEYRSDWNGSARYSAASEAENKRMLQVLKTALSKYPQSFFLRLRLRYIALGKNPTSPKGAPLSGMSLGNTQQTYLLLNVKAPEMVIHHELFHCFEYASGYVFYDWKDANISGFRYDPSSDTSSMPMLPPGFVTRYATTMEEEDRAELFMYLMTESVRPALLEQAAHDSVLKDKTQILIKAMKRYFGKLADRSRFVMVADQVAAASKPQILGYAYVEEKASLYAGPATKYPMRKEASKGAALPVVTRGSTWLEVLDTDGKSLYVQAKDIVFQSGDQRDSEKLALSRTAANISRKSGVTVMFEGWNKQPSKLSLSASQDNARIRSMLDELSVLLGDDGKASVGSIKNIYLCDSLSVGGARSETAVNGASLYLNMTLIGEGSAGEAIRTALQGDVKAA